MDKSHCRFGKRSVFYLTTLNSCTNIRRLDAAKHCVLLELLIFILFVMNLELETPFSMIKELRNMCDGLCFSKFSTRNPSLGLFCVSIIVHLLCPNYIFMNVVKNTLNESSLITIHVVSPLPIPFSGLNISCDPHLAAENKRRRRLKQTHMSAVFRKSVQ